MSDHAGDVRDRPEQWEVVASRIIHEDDWILTFREDTVVRPGHPEQPLARLVLDHPGAVAVLAIDDQERVRCLRQYRHSSGMKLIELPAGLCDGGPGEEPLETAKRELREEAQLRAADWRHLFTTWPTRASPTRSIGSIWLAGCRTGIEATSTCMVKKPNSSISGCQWKS
ncbi:MAG: NUDIX hydrolase [Marmoricola sp.]